MATTTILPMHMNKGRSLLQSLSARTDYVMNPDKTNERELISSYECEPATVDTDFLIAKQMYQRITGREPKQGKDVIAYQIRQAFYPGEITPEEANALGYKLAMEFTKGQHQFIVATHVDKAHVHNHIVFNSTTLDCTHKFNNYLRSSDDIRDISDRLCLEHGYSIIEEPAKKGKQYAEWNAEKSGTSWKEKLRNNIEEQIQGCKNYEQFLHRMELLGYEIKQGKYIAFRAPDQKKFTRAKTLGDEFTEEAICAKIAMQISVKKKKYKKTWSYDEPSIPQLIDLQKKIEEGKGTGYQRWAKIFNMKAMSKSLVEASNKGLHTIEDIAEFVQTLQDDFDVLSEQLKAEEAKLRDVKTLKSAIIEYGKTRDSYSKYRVSGKSKKFYEEHRSDIERHLNAKKVFDQFGIKKKVSIKDLNAQYEEIAANRKTIYERYKEKRTELQKWQTIQSNLESCFRRAEKQKHQALER
ncbi:MAG: relaxase/mobilization nuclease domain-containing protein [Lachnospiraceae bacterium]|nr:relaxase/mobilization nuclease domain-containing protein [Lachnospiraceae bacterium]